MANGLIVAAAGAQDSGEKQRWVETNYPNNNDNNNNSNSNKVYTQKHIHKPTNPSYIPHPQTCTSSTDDDSTHRFNTVASDDSSSRNHSQPVPQIPTNGNSMPGYVRLDDSKVKISLNSRSKLEIRQLKRKLVGDLHQVRSLRKKLEEAKEIQCNNGFNENRVATTLARVNSEVSYVGPTNLLPVTRDNVSGQNRVATTLDTDFVMGKKRFSNAVSSKKLKAVGGGEVMGFSKDLVKKCWDLLGKLMRHQYGWVFNAPVDVEKLKLHDYYIIIKHPMDLGTVKSRLSKNWYKSPMEFAEDVRLTFNNAMRYNEKGQDAHTMADALLKIFEENWATVRAKFNFSESLPKQISKRTLVPASTPAQPPIPNPARAASKPAPASAPPQMPLETRTFDRPEPMTMPVEARHIATNQGSKPVLKKPQAKDPEKRDMSYEEKQKLSANLQSLPSEKLDTVVQIIRKRNPGLFQQEDEIEVDIDSFDTETLWELNRFVTNYKKSLSKNKGNAEVALEGREEAGHNIQESNLTSATAVVPKEPEGFLKIAATSLPVQGKKQGDNMSGSRGSSSSSSDSASSSSDSDSDSSLRYGSDACQ